MRIESARVKIGERPGNDRTSRGISLEPLARSARRAIAPSNIDDVLHLAFLVALVFIAFHTVTDYAISNDESVQHRYGELIIAYYQSGFRLRDVFTFENLYLYGGLFDVLAISLGHIVPIDVFELRHILCAMMGIAGIAAAGATARLIGGPRAGLVAVAALTCCGAWYGTMFNHTKDIPFAAAMAGATLVLVRLARQLPSPRPFDIAAFGCLAGAALGVRSYGLLLFVYLGLAIAINSPWSESWGERLRFAAASVWRTCPALAIAYLLMVLAWPWAALSPLNPIRGLFAFSEFHYAIRTLFAGRVYEMADVPRIYVPGYLFFRVPLVTQIGVGLALMSLGWRPAEPGSQRRRDLALLSITLLFPILCQVLVHGPAFSGMRHFLFVLPPLAALAGVGLSDLLDAIALRNRHLTSAAVTILCVSFLWDGSMLARLHPYESLSYNALVGGLPGAFRRYDLDYWFNSMPEAIHKLEALLREEKAADAVKSTNIYSVAVCGERLPFDRSVTLPQLRWDFRSEWDESEFFIAPTQMNCDHDLDGKVVASVERFGVPIAYVKDRRAIVKRPVSDSASPLAGLEPTGKNIAQAVPFD